jgi:hypothetical protein
VLAEFNIAGATLFPAYGVWFGDTELVFVLEVISQDKIDGTGLAAELARVFEQNHVLLHVQANGFTESVLVSPTGEVKAA